MSYDILCHSGSFSEDASYEQIWSWVMDEFIHWPKPYLLLSTICDEILSWIIDNWMKNHLVSDNKCNTVNL